MIDYTNVVQTNLKIEKDNVVVIFSNGRLNAVSCVDGEVLWKKDFEAERLVQFESFSFQQLSPSTHSPLKIMVSLIYYIALLLAALRFCMCFSLLAVI